MTSTDRTEVGRTPRSLNLAEVVELTDVSDLERCEELQRSVWRSNDRGLVPVNQLRAAQQAGGLVAGAVADGQLVGFCYGFPSYRPEIHERPGLHSHMTGVVGAARSQGVGRELKWFQRHWCLERGLAWVEWTFDPLRAANARFNLEHLGATAGEYLVDTYGPLQDALNVGLPTDRLMAHWDLASPQVSAVAKGQRAGPAPEPAAAALAAKPDGGPGEPDLEILTGTVSIAVPPDLSELLTSQPQLTLSWRTATRQAFSHYLAKGYKATRFVEGAYLLERAEAL